MQRFICCRREVRNFVLAVGIVSLAVMAIPPARAQAAPLATAPAPRERWLMDPGWRFAFGHPYDPQNDFGTGTGYFSYLAKTGYGDGAAAPDFDDRAWRTLDLPHDWAVEVPFDGRGSHSHGYKAIGRNFPDSSVGWYRKTFFIPQSDLGRRISVEFDGVFRDSRVWVNGHYLGNEPDGYTGFACNISEFLNYGGNNVIAVRADATMEEGWFYEGAGIYRHTWLVKTGPLHITRDGTFITCELKGPSATVTARVAVANEGTNDARFSVEQTVVDADGKTVATGRVKDAKLSVADQDEFSTGLKVPHPKLWSIETPYRYTLVTTIRSEGTVVDRYTTPFGIRSISFDPDRGFFLNGRRVELKGANNHQDHAGVGVAIPDALQDFRIARLKAFGCNAYRCSHNPPTPELLDACDRLGMVVIDENRLMGTSADQLDHLQRMILRDRNHPSVVLWSLGNEEWAIEGNVRGARITATMQAFARRLDPTRRTTVAISGGWGGTSTVIDVAGYNYINQSNPDKQHAAFPNQPGVGTEETTTQGTRGVYFDDRSRAHLAPLARGDSGGNCEKGWKYYAARPYLAGLFYWTGFDYRGEETPFGWPAISSQFGLLDTCGFPKDSFYYLKSWWTDPPMVHLFPHWNWPGKEGREITVSVDSNCEEVELVLNGRNLGRKTMKKYSHLEWDVAYQPGVLQARGFYRGTEIAGDRVETTGEPAAIELIPDRPDIKANDEDVSVITVRVNDAQGRFMPVATNEITFKIKGPGKIIGVGNGDPSSHEPDRFFEHASSTPVGNWHRQEVAGLANRPEIAPDFDDSGWPAAFDGNRHDDSATFSRTNLYRGTFELAAGPNATMSLLLHDLGENEWVYLNGKMVAENVQRRTTGHEFKLAPDRLRPGTNILVIIATPRAGRGRDESSRNPGSPAVVKMVMSPGEWKRSVFNGLAQLVVQSTRQPGKVTLTAGSPGLSPGAVDLVMQPAVLRPVVPPAEVTLSP